VIDPTLAEGNRYQRLLTRIRREGQRAGIADPRRIQLVVAIDRLLARLLVSAAPGAWVIKGGFANQLRRPQDARFTEDIDLRVSATIDEAPQLLADAFAAHVDDLFSYEIASGPLPLHGPPGGGARFIVVTRYDGSELVSFKVDISAADPVVGELERHLSDPVVERLGFVRSTFPVYPVAQSIAEKLHAQTMPREQENTRARDLVDLVWFCERFSVGAEDLIEACEATFAVRASHPWPPTVDDAPPSWAKPYERERRALQLGPATTNDATALVRRFFEPVFLGQGGSRWSPATLDWVRQR
jgi:predicted nucleotidyltransferase component of viral defense system